MADTTEGTDGGDKQPSEPDSRKLKGDSTPENTTDRGLRRALILMTTLWVLAALHCFLPPLHFMPWQAAVVFNLIAFPVLFFMPAVAALVLLVWSAPNIVARIRRRQSVLRRHWIGLVAFSLLCWGYYYPLVWGFEAVVVLWVVVILLLIAFLLHMMLRLVAVKLTLGRLLVIGLILSPCVAGSLFWYQSHKRAQCDRSAQGDAQRLALSAERLLTEAFDLAARSRRSPKSSCPSL